MNSPSSSCPTLCPDPVYHGTRRSFERFDFSTLGSNVDNPTTLWGAYFTETVAGARRWIDYRRTCPDAFILSARVQIERPYDMPAVEFSYFLRDARRRECESFLRRIKRLGHDGMRIAYVRDFHKGGTDSQVWWVAFAPDQIVILSSQPILPHDGP